MKKILSASIASLAFCALPLASAHAQAPYEGTATLAMITAADSDTNTVTVNMKGGKTEIDIDAGVQGLIKLYPDFKKHSMKIALMSQKSGQEVPLQDPSTSTLKVDLKPLGKKETIAGFSAEAYSLSIPEADFTLWATADMPKNLRTEFQSALAPIMQDDKNIGAALKQLGEKNLVPIKVEIAPKGVPDQNATIVFLKAEPKKMADAIFDLPKDVKFKSPGAPGQPPPANDGGAPH